LRGERAEAGPRGSEAAKHVFEVFVGGQGAAAGGLLEKGIQIRKKDGGGGGLGGGEIVFYWNGCALTLKKEK